MTSVLYLNGAKMICFYKKLPSTEEDGPHCLDLDLNGKRPGVGSDGNFSSYLIGRS